MKNTRTYFILYPGLFFIILTLYACGIGGSRGTGGDVVGVRHPKFKADVPYGMVYIPGGTFVFGQNGEDITFSSLALNKQVSITPFYMDETEITNAAYRQFVYYVRDSIAVKEYLNDESYFTNYSKKGSKSRKGGVTADAGPAYINWDKVKKGGMWKNLYDSKSKKKPKKGGRNKKGASQGESRLNDMFYQGEDKVFNKKEIAVEKLKYVYAFFNFREAADNRFVEEVKDNGTRTGNFIRSNIKRSKYIYRDTIEVYPDTLVWLADFSYSHNDPMVLAYFNHASYDDYPVVGVTWKQARAFSIWRTEYYDNYKTRSKDPNYRLPYRLPSEIEFEYAARGGHQMTAYPWGNYYIKNAKGCLLANFKPGRGDYVSDGGVYTVQVRSYYANDYGLYCMSGNVSEWTSSAFTESANSFVHDLNPIFDYEAKDGDPPILKRKVIRGGSWKDIGYFLQVSSRIYEYQDTCKSYIGFRCVSSYPGRDLLDRNR